MVQAAFFDPFAFEQDGLSASEVDVGGSEIVEALMVTAMILMLDEGRDLGFKVLLEEVVFKQDAVLQRLVPAFDFPLRLRVAGSAVNLVDLVFLQPFAEIGSARPSKPRKTSVGRATSGAKTNIRSYEISLSKSHFSVAIITFGARERRSVPHG